MSIDRKAKAHTHVLPSHDGDGYSYGGGTILTIGDFALALGTNQFSAELAGEIAFRWNYYNEMREARSSEQRAREQWEPKP